MTAKKLVPQLNVRLDLSRFITTGLILSCAVIVLSFPKKSFAAVYINNFTEPTSSLVQTVNGRYTIGVLGTIGITGSSVPVAIRIFGQTSSTMQLLSGAPFYSGVVPANPFSGAGVGGNLSSNFSLPDGSQVFTGTMNVTAGDTFGVVFTNATPSEFAINAPNTTSTINGNTDAYFNIIGCVGDSTSSVEGAGCEPPMYAPTLSFEYPIANSTTPQFSPWIFSLSNLSSTDSYYVSVHWQQIQYGTGASYLNLPQGYFQIFGDTGNPVTGNTSSTYPIPRPDRNLNYLDDGNTADIWTATGYLFDTTIGSSFIASTTEQFTLDRYLLLNTVKTNGTSTYVTPLITSTGTVVIATTTNGFSAPVLGASTFNASSSCPNDTLGLCSVFMFLFNPSYFSGQSTAPLMQQGVSSLASSTPFAVVFKTIYSVEGAVSSTPSSLDASYNGSFGSVTGTISFLTSSTGEIAFGSNFKNTFFPYEDDAMYLLTLAVMFFVPFHWWRKKHHMKSA